MADRTVQIAVPKFRVESDLSLAALWPRLGMRSAFTGAADFSGIDDRRDLQLSEVVHKAYVDVTEEGTEAAAASGAVVALIARPQTLSEPVFRADYSFLFFSRKDSLRADPL